LRGKWSAQSEGFRYFALYTPVITGSLFAHKQPIPVIHGTILPQEPTHKTIRKSRPMDHKNKSCDDDKALDFDYLQFYGATDTVLLSTLTKSRINRSIYDQ